MNVLIPFTVSEETYRLRYLTFSIRDSYVESHRDCSHILDAGYAKARPSVLVIYQLVLFFVLVSVFIGGS